MNTVPPNLRKNGPAFTLLELIVVLAIVSILTTVALTAVQPVSESYGVTNSSQVLRDTLSNAKQLAVSDNQPVQFRFCRSTQAGATGGYCFLLLCEVQPNGTLKVAERPVHFPAAMSLATSTTLSSLMSLAEQTPAATDPSPPPLGQQYAYRKITFYPSGATDLAPTSIWFLAVVPQRFSASSTLPSNYAVVQIDPVNALTVLYRP